MADGAAFVVEVTTVREAFADPALTARLLSLTTSPGSGLSKWFGNLSLRPHPHQRHTPLFLARALDGGRVLGWAMAWHWWETWTYRDFGVYVEPEARGRGVGRALLAVAAETVAPVPLAVWAVDDDSIRLYRSARRPPNLWIRDTDPPAQ